MIFAFTEALRLNVIESLLLARTRRTVRFAPSNSDSPPRLTLAAVESWFNRRVQAAPKAFGYCTAR